MLNWLDMQERFLSRRFIHQLLDYETFTHGINFVDMAVSLLLATILGIWVARTYRKTQRGVNYSANFEVSTVLICVIVTVIMAVVGSNIARAFSLIGALSIIRFRTAVRSAVDITFIFFAVALGLCVGSRFWITALFSTLWFVTLCRFLVIRTSKRMEQDRQMLVKARVIQENFDPEYFSRAASDKGGSGELLSFHPDTGKLTGKDTDRNEAEAVFMFQSLDFVSINQLFETSKGVQEHKVICSRLQEIT